MVSPSLMPYYWVSVCETQFEILFDFESLCHFAFEFDLVFVSCSVSQWAFHSELL